MEFVSFLVGVGIFLFIIIVPLAMVVIGLGLFAGAIQTIHDALKGNKNGRP